MNIDVVKTNQVILLVWNWTLLKDFQKMAERTELNMTDLLVMGIAMSKKKKILDTKPYISINVEKLSAKTIYCATHVINSKILPKQ